MTQGFDNVYAHAGRARAYAELGFPGTYFLAFRDLPALLQKHVQGTRALDFCCGTGRSTRFLRGLGYEVIGVDVAQPMIEQARERDPAGDYRVVADGSLAGLPTRGFDLALAPSCGGSWRLGVAWGSSCPRRRSTCTSGRPSAPATSPPIAMRVTGTRSRL